MEGERKVDVPARFAQAGVDLAALVLFYEAVCWGAGLRAAKPTRAESEILLEGMPYFAAAGAVAIGAIRARRGRPAPMSRAPRLARAVARAVLIATATLAGAQIAGWAVTRAAPGFVADYFHGVYEQDEAAGYSVRAYLGTRTGPRTDSVLSSRPMIRTGPRGFWRTDAIPPPGAGARRILFLGDSLFCGSHLRPFDEIVRARLAARSADSFLVFNAAVPAYSIDQSLVRYRTRCRDLGAEAVVLGLYVGNDLELSGTAEADARGDPLRVLVTRYIDGRGQIHTGPPDRILSRPFASTRWFLERRTDLPILADLLAWRRITLLHAATTPPPPARLDPSYRGDWEMLNPRPGPATEAKWEAVFETLRRMRRIVEEDGARFALVVVPVDVQVHPRYWAKHPVPGRSESFGDTAAFEATFPQTRLRAFCRDASISILDLLPAFRRASGDLYYGDDPHWNDAGNAVAGERIAEWILRDFSG